VEDACGLHACNDHPPLADPVARTLLDMHSPDSSDETRTEPLRIDVPTWALFTSHIDPASFRAYCALRTYRARGAYPLIDDMAAELGIHRTTLYRQFDELEREGFIQRHLVRGANGKRVATFTLADDGPLIEQPERLSQAS
jgi:AraC-like DNA-binding protein